jgi:hypothetical protein
MGNPTLLVAHSERRPAPVASKILAFAFPVVRCRGKRLCWSQRPADHLMKESLVNRIGTSRLRRVEAPRRHLPPLAAMFTSPSARSIVAALIARTRSRSPLPSFNRPWSSSAGSEVGIITFSRLPYTRSDASHSAVSASSMMAPYLRLR